MEKSEIKNILNILNGTCEEEILKQMQQYYSQISKVQAQWYSKSNFTCLEGCGECCRNFEPDLLECEATYMAAWLLENQKEVAEKVSQGYFPFPDNKAGHEVTIAQFPIGALGKALAMGEIEGFFRLIADAKTDELLGAQIMGAHASDIIAELALAISQKMTAKQLGDVIHAHPSLAEGVMEAAHAIHKLCVHQAPPRK